MPSYDLPVARLVLGAADRLGYWRPREGTPWDVFLFGVRSPAASMGAFDDVLGAVVWDGLSWRSWLWRGTTDPGREGTSADDGRLHPSGVATLIPGQYRGAWRLGLHKGKPAFTQAGPGAFRVWRDRDKDGKIATGGPAYDDVAGLNGHRPWRNGLERVGLASLGCQVWHDSGDHDEALDVARRQQHEHPTWTTYSYTLLTVRSSPELAALLDPVRRAP